MDFGLILKARMHASGNFLLPCPDIARFTGAASFLLINNLIGLGVGPLLMGRLSDAFKSTYGADALRNAAVVCLSFYALAALLMLFSIRSLRASWIPDEA